MNDLNTLLERAAGPTTAPVDAHADLTRGHRALSRTRRRRGALGLVGVAAAGVVGVGVARFTEPGGDVAADTRRRVSRSGTGIHPPLSPSRSYGRPLHLRPAPEGWEVQGTTRRESPSRRSTSPTRSRHPSSQVMVILFDCNPLSGEQVQRRWPDLLGPRRSGSTRTHHDRRPSWGAHRKRADPQFPDDTGWDPRPRSPSSPACTSAPAPSRASAELSQSPAYAGAGSPPTPSAPPTVRGRGPGDPPKGRPRGPSTPRPGASRAAGLPRA